MRGLKALLKIKTLQERKAQKSLAKARGELERLTVLEKETYQAYRNVQQAIKALESKDFEVREAIVQRRYLNALGGRLIRLREVKAEAQKRFQQERERFERAKQEREAVQTLIERKKEREREERRRKEEKALEDRIQRSWIREKLSG